MVKLSKTNTILSCIVEIYINMINIGIYLSVNESPTF